MRKRARRSARARRRAELAVPINSEYSVFIVGRRIGMVTGASRGLGLALSRAMADRGWSLAIDARGAEALERARAELAARTDVVAVTGDVSDEGHLRALVEAAAGLGEGSLDALVNNASLLGPSPQPRLIDYPMDVFEDVYR